MVIGKSSTSSKWLTPRQYFSSSGEHPRKSLGQNFLVSTGTAIRIVQEAELDWQEPVVEIGPGLGALTRHLVSRVRDLTLVEVDHKLAAYLATQLEGRAPSVEIWCEDILKVSWMDLHRRYGRSLVVLGNLPYHITSPLMFRLLGERRAIDRAIFMVQREVGERFVASPGTKAYGVLTVLLGIYTRPGILFRVSPKQFYPVPQVESIVVRIDFKRSEPDSVSFASLKRVVTAAFRMRRKTLLNSLSKAALLDRSALGKMLEEAGIDPNRRPEELNPEEYLFLARLLKA